MATKALAEPLPHDIGSVSSAWLTGALQQRYPGTEVTESHVGTVIAGTATKVRLLLSYNAQGNAYGLPPTMWLKGGFIRHDHTYDDSFVCEAQFFQEWAQRLPINIPKSYYADYQIGHQGLVLLEDLCARNVTFGWAPDPISVDQQAQTLVLLAKMHARWWQSPELEGLKSFTTIWTGADQVVMRMLEPEYFGACMARPRCREITADYRDRERLTAGLRTQWRRAAEIPQCFSHGDAHLGNMFFERNGAPGFLDWQSWQSGPYMHDVAYSIIGNLTVDDRRAHDRDLIAGYLAALQAAGVSHLPALDDACEAYRRHAMHGFMWAFTPTEMQPEDVCEAEGWRFAVAVADLDTFGALGV